MNKYGQVTLEYYSPKKKKKKEEVLLHAMTLLNLRNNMLSERSQTQKIIYDSIYMR